MRIVAPLAVLLVAAEPADDPGAWAFRRGLERAAAGDRAGAADEFARTAADVAAPSERRARALYNRGTLLLASDDAATLAEAVRALEAGRDTAPDDPVLRGDIAFNLELAKRRLVLAAERPKPDPGGDADPPPGSGPNGRDGSGEGRPQPGAGGADGPPGEADAEPRPGAGNLPVTTPGAIPTNLSADESRRIVREIARRSAERRRAGGTLGGPEWGHVPNW